MFPISAVYNNSSEVSESALLTHRCSCCSNCSNKCGDCGTDSLFGEMQRQLDIENSDQLKKAISFVEAKVIEEKQDIPSDDDDANKEEDDEQDGEDEDEVSSEDDE